MKFKGLSQGNKFDTLFPKRESLKTYFISKFSPHIFTVSITSILNASNAAKVAKFVRSATSCKLFQHFCLFLSGKTLQNHGTHFFFCLLYDDDFDSNKLKQMTIPLLLKKMNVRQTLPVIST